jgi:hypothetical protein
MDLSVIAIVPVVVALVAVLKGIPAGSAGREQEGRNRR